MRIQRSSESHFRQLISPETGENYSLSNAISEHLNSKDLFFSHEIVRPGSRSSGSHFHSETDEIIFVLSGELIAVEDETEIHLATGDSVLFGADSGKRHYLKNISTSDAQALVVRRNTVSTDVVF